MPSITCAVQSSQITECASSKTAASVGPRCRIAAISQKRGLRLGKESPTPLCRLQISICYFSAGNVALKICCMCVSKTQPSELSSILFLPIRCCKNEQLANETGVGKRIKPA